MIMKDFYQNKTIIEPSDDLIKLKDLALKTSFVEPNCFNNPLKVVKTWFDERFFLYKNIPFISIKKLNKIIDMPINLIMQNTNLISPLQVPLLYVDERKDYGCFTPIYLENNENNYDLIFTEIRLNNKNSIFLSLIYLHEIIHIIVENNDSTITNYKDYELLPIIFEFLLSDDLGSDIFNFAISYRINQLNNYIDMLFQQNMLSKIYASSYINSIIIAYELINFYKSKNLLIKKEFINDLKSILNEKNDVYWLLEKYNVDYNLSLNKLIKRKG